MSKGRLPPLPQVSDIIRLYRLSARSQLSQNFLLNLSITDKFVRVAGKLNDCCVCEVGPGPGSLTRSILNGGAKKVVVVEKDRRFIPSLELLQDASEDRLSVHHGDALDFDIPENCGQYVEETKWHEDPPNFHIIGNLPFNVSIPLLLKWLSMIPERKGPFTFGRSQLTLCFQKEVAERITAPISHHQRSRLSIMAQHLCHIHWGFLIKGSSFVPPPKVDTVVLKFTPLVQPEIEVDYLTLEKVVKSLFQFRRKYIRRGAMLLFPDKSVEEQKKLSQNMFKLSGVSDTLRAQQLTLEQYKHLCEAYLTVFNTYNKAASEDSDNNPFDNGASEDNCYSSTVDEDRNNADNTTSEESNITASYNTDSNNIMNTLLPRPSLDKS